MLLVNVFRELNRAKVRYLVAGGVASVLYGNPRFTKDLDLFVDLGENNLTKLVHSFKILKFIPRVPVKAEEFISSENRRRWMREKRMLAFTFINPRDPIESVDILLSSPVPFDKAYRRKKFFMHGTIRIPTVSIQDLMLMKKKAGRVQDLQDLEILKAALKEKRKMK